MDLRAPNERDPPVPTLREPFYVPRARATAPDTSLTEKVQKPAPCAWKGAMMPVRADAAAKATLGD